MIDENNLWDGPEPSEQEKSNNQNWMVDQLVKYPYSIAWHDKRFPQVANKARAILRYKELETLKVRGAITDEFYNIELDKILPFIDIQNDLK